QIVLIEREEATAGRDAGGARGGELARVVGQRGQDARLVGKRGHGVVGADALHGPQDHREVERGGIADVALDARETRIEHQYSQRFHAHWDRGPPGPLMIMMRAWRPAVPKIMTVPATSLADRAPLRTIWISASRRDRRSDGRRSPDPSASLP